MNTRLAVKCRQIGLVFACLLVSCSSEDAPPTAREWAPEGYEVVWHHEAASVAPREEWGTSGLDPLADVLDEAGTTPYELILETHSGAPAQTGADPASWGFPLHFGLGGPFADDGQVHMFECSARGAVFDQGDYLAFCQPGVAILYIAYRAAGRVPVDETPNPPDTIRGWWESTIAFQAGSATWRRENLTVVPKYAYYGRSNDGYEVPITFEPRPAAYPAPYDDTSVIERWRVAKFDDR